jgi:putative transposase
VWSVDITYIRLPRGFAYRVALIDGYSRKVLSGRISNSMEAVFCVDCLADALRHHGTPEIFNSDQGSQFTRTAFTDVLKREGGSSAWMAGARVRHYLCRTALAQR